MKWKEVRLGQELPREGTMVCVYGIDLSEAGKPLHAWRSPRMGWIEKGAVTGTPGPSGSIFTHWMQLPPRPGDLDALQRMLNKGSK